MSKVAASFVALALALALSVARAGETVFFAFDDVSIPWRSKL